MQSWTNYFISLEAHLLSLDKSTGTVPAAPIHPGLFTVYFQHHPDHCSQLLEHNEFPVSRLHVQSQFSTGVPVMCNQ